MNDKSLRQQIAGLLESKEAHADFRQAVSDIPPALRGTKPQGAPHSAWELLEHLRIAQRDILEFSRNTRYKSPKWPEGYWPSSPEPPRAAAWTRAIKHYERDSDAMKRLILNPRTDLLAKIPWGTGQTILREALLLADHNAYHIGQLVLLRRFLGAWEKD